MKNEWYHESANTYMNNISLFLNSTMAKMCNSILKRKEEGGVKNDKKSQTCDQGKKSSLLRLTV